MEPAQFGFGSSASWIWRQRKPHEAIADLRPIATERPAEAWTKWSSVGQAWAGLTDAGPSRLALY